MQSQAARFLFAVTLAIPVAPVLGFSALAGADTITTGALTAQAAGSGINDDGNLIPVSSGYYAAAFDSTTGGTVGGINFTGFVGKNGTGSGGMVTLVDFGHDYTGYFTTAVTTGDSALDAVLKGGDYADTTTVGQITINNLSAGQAYETQFFVVDNRSSQIGRSVQIANNSTFSNVGSGSYTSPVVNYAVGGSPGVGSYIDWTFTAAGTSQTFYDELTNVNSSSTQFGSPQGTQINALIISPTPEPASMALIALGAAASMLFLRHRRILH